MIPLLRNGKTPEHQTILTVLEEIGKHVGNDRWNIMGNDAQLKLGLCYFINQIKKVFIIHVNQELNLLKPEGLIFL